jgi:hypothetical protein
MLPTVCPKARIKGYCCPTADKAPDVFVRSFLFLRILQVKKRADERIRTAFLLQLRVIIHVLQAVARACKSRISKPVPFLRFALCCTVLRSRWYQSGINSGNSCFAILPIRSTHLKYVQHLTEHASIQLTLDRYSHWMPSMGRNTAEGIDGALG